MKKQPKRKEKKRGRAATIVPAGPNLVTTWRKIVTEGGRQPLAKGLDDLNRTLGTNYRHSRITEWEQVLRGRQPGQAVINYMLDIVLPVLLVDAGLPRDTARSITSQVKVAEKKEVGKMTRNANPDTGKPQPE